MEDRKEYVQRRMTEILAAFELPGTRLRILEEGERPVAIPGHQHRTDGNHALCRNSSKYVYYKATYCIRQDSDGDIVDIEVTTQVDIHRVREVLRQLDPRGVRVNARRATRKSARRMVPQRILRSQQNRAILEMIGR